MWRGFIAVWVFVALTSAPTLVSAEVSQKDAQLIDDLALFYTDKSISDLDRLHVDVMKHLQEVIRASRYPDTMVLHKRLKDMSTVLTQFSSAINKVSGSVPLTTEVLELKKRTLYYYSELNSTLSHLVDSIYLEDVQGLENSIKRLTILQDDKVSFQTYYDKIAAKVAVISERISAEGSSHSAQDGATNRLAKDSSSSLKNLQIASNFHNQSHQLFDEGLRAYQAKDYKTAKSIWQWLADKSRVDLQYHLGHGYHFKTVSDTDKDEADQLLQKSINSSD
tara:strand:+ start:236 stop:1072 length:837 start_codon:yes stop_codon:yes gene_type:complete